jgi:hypothetical protein
MPKKEKETLEVDPVGHIEVRARDILDEYFPDWDRQPSSISGRFHGGDTMGKHIEKTVTIMKHLCLCFGISQEDRDMLIASCLLHDVGRTIITSPVEMSLRHWKYFPRTRHCRLEPLFKIHGPIGSAVVEDYKIPRKEEIQELIGSHMGHWAPLAPQPITFYQHLVCVADYMASRNGDIFKFPEEELIPK